MNIIFMYSNGKSIGTDLGQTAAPAIVSTNAQKDVAIIIVKGSLKEFRRCVDIEILRDGLVNKK